MAPKGLKTSDLMRARGYIPVKEAAKRLGKSVPYIYGLLESGAVHGVSIPPSGKWARRYVEAKSLVSFVGAEMAKLLGLV